MRRECRERFPPPPISKETASLRSRHASRHVRDARAVMHVGIAYLRWRGKRSRHSRRMRTCNFAYLVRGLWGNVPGINHLWCSFVVVPWLNMFPTLYLTINSLNCELYHVNIIVNVLCYHLKLTNVYDNHRILMVFIHGCKVLWVVIVFVSTV